MPTYDISVGISSAQTPVYPGDPGIEITAHASLARGDAANVTAVRFGAHTATHLDAPAHFIEGAGKLPEIPLETLIGEARVVEIPEYVSAVDEVHVGRLVPEGAARVLFKTRNSGFWAKHGREFRRDFTYVTPGGARALVRRGVRLVGADYLSVEQFRSQRHETHHTLLGGGVVILEGLDLSGIVEGTYELICLPLKLAEGHGDGAPARAVLRSYR